MRLGNTEISSVKLGSSQVQAVYLGNNLVWQNAPVATAATGVGSTSFTANWEAFTGAYLYLLDVSTSSTFDTFVYENQVVYAPTTSYVVIGLNSNTTYYYRVRASDYELEAQAFFDRVTTAGGTLSTTEKNAVNILVTDMKADGIWTKMKAIYPMVGASAAACSQNLKSSSFTGTFTATGWTFASTGATPNGTNAYMNTGILPTTQLSISSAHLSQYVNTNINLAVIMGNNDLSCFLQPQTTIIYGGLASTTFISGNTSNNQSGFYLVNRPASNSLKIIKNNSILNTATTTGTAYSSGQNIFVGAYSSSSNFSNARIAFSSIGDGLTDTEASDFYTAVQAFQTTLSRQV